MGIEELRKEILKEADEKVNRILSEAQAKADEIVKEAEKKAKYVIEKKKESALKSSREKEKSELAIARIEGKRLVYEKKWKLVDLVFKKVVEKLENYKSDDKYFDETLPLYIFNGIQSLNSNEVILMMNKNDYNIVKSKLRSIEKRLSEKLGRKLKLILDDKPVRIMGGVILSSSDRNVFYNSSFDAKLVDAREKLAADILNMLFG